MPRAWKKKREREKDYSSWQKCGIMDAFLREQLRSGGHGQAPWEESSGKGPSVSWTLNSILAAVRVSMYILRKFKRMVVSSFLGLSINHLRAQSRRRAFRSGYPLRSFQQGGEEINVYKWNQPFLSALLHLACNGRPGKQSWGTTKCWGGGLRSLVFGRAASPWAGRRLPSSI